MWLLKACRVCLATEVKLFRIEPLLHSYQTLTGLSDACGLQYVCYECAAQLGKFQKLREKSLKSLAILESLFNEEDEITLGILEAINREKNNLLSPLKICLLEYWEVKSTAGNIIEIEIKGESENYMQMGIVKQESNDLDSFGDTLLFVPENDDKPLKVISQVSQGLQITSPNKTRRKRLTAKSGCDKSQVRKYTNKKPNEQRQRTIDKRRERSALRSKFVDVVLLTQEEALENIRKRRETVNYMSSMFKCEMCYKGFWEESTFNNHMATHDPSNGPFECDFCHLRVASRKSLLKHIRARHKWKYACRRCPHVSTNGSTATQHEAWHNGASYSCVHCNETFSYYSTMKNHERIKHARELSCRLCGLCFVGRRGIALHVVKAHAGKQVKVEEEHACEECDVKFASLEALKRHRVVSAKHNLKETANGCHVCGEVFPSPELYTAHYRRAHTRRIPKWWRRQNAGKPRGDKQVETEVELERQQVRRNAAHGARVVKRREAESGNHMCEICGRVCQSLAGFRDHLRKHSGERPHKCSFCPKAFTLKELLQSHTRTHTKERPYRCEICSRAFSACGNLKRHIKMVHSEAKPVYCNICAKPFKNSVCLKDHIKYVHMKVPYPVRRRNRKNQTATSAEDTRPCLLGDERARE